MGEATNIYPIYEKMMTRSDKEQLLGQRGVMVWFTGLSGSGKSTVALGVERELHKRGAAFWMVIIFVAVSIRI